VSHVFQNIDPPPPSLPGKCVPPAFVWGAGGGGGGRTDSPGGEGGGGSILWKTRDIGLPSYSNNLSTVCAINRQNYNPCQYGTPSLNISLG
jgi:hypothetical protein